MTYSSCVRQPENNRYIQINEWQIQFCQGNHCAALLLSFFISWHEWKLKNDQYYHKANNIAEAHGDGRPLNEHAYMFFSMEEFIAGTLNFYGKNAINEAIQFLELLGVITIHTNPNERYRFDKTKYFKFYPAICNHWIAENYPLDGQKNLSCTQPVDSIHTPKQDNRSTETGRRFAEIGQPSSETGNAITYTTNNTTNKINQSTKTRKNFIEQNKIPETQDAERRAKVQHIIDVLTSRGFLAKHFTYPDTIETLQRLCDLGATVDVFTEAHIISARTSRSFGVNYLAKVVEDLLHKLQTTAEKLKTKKNVEEYNFESEKNDYSGGLDWLGDLVG